MSLLQLPQLHIFLLSMLPITELRGALPLALTVYELPLWQAYFWSVLGNLVPVFFLLWFWQSSAMILSRKSKIIDKFLNYLFKCTRRKFQGKYQKWGEFALVVFVAIPLPMTGAWTGTLAAWLFGVKYWQAVKLIFFGVLISGIIVTIITQGSISFLKIFL